MSVLRKAMCVALIAAVLVAALAPPAEAAVTCDTVFFYLRSCTPYVSNQGPLGTCCRNVKGLYSAARTTSDRQAVCRCLKDLAKSSHSKVNLRKAAGLPKQCGVNIPYPISPNTDCAKVR